MRQVIKHRDIRLLNMIRRTDPEIHNSLVGGVPAKLIKLLENDVEEF